MRELTLVDALERYLSERGYQTTREVPFLHRIVDLVAVSEVSQSIVMVEAKISKWRKAINQARPCLLGADEVYIAMPSIYAHRVDQDILQDHGIGLIVVGDSVEIRLESQRSWGKVEHHADQVRLTVESRLRKPVNEHNPHRG